MDGLQRAGRLLTAGFVAGDVPRATMLLGPEKPEMSHLRCHVPLRSTEPAQIGNSAVLSRVRGLCSEHDVIGSSLGFRSGTRGLQDQFPDRTGPLFLPISRSRGPMLRSRQNPACLYRGHGGTEIRIRNPETQPGLLQRLAPSRGISWGSLSPWLSAAL